jgi:hypothetical protein
MNDFKNILLPLKPLSVEKLRKHYQSTKVHTHSYIRHVQQGTYNMIKNKQIAPWNSNEYTP